MCLGLHGTLKSQEDDGIDGEATGELLLLQPGALLRGWADIDGRAREVWHGRAMVQTIVAIMAQAGSQEMSTPSRVGVSRNQTPPRLLGMTMRSTAQPLPPLNSSL